MNLQPVSRQGERRTAALQGGGDALSFSFDDVLPGKYKGLPASAGEHLLTSGHEWKVQI